jgi:hypothetical protein
MDMQLHGEITVSAATRHNLREMVDPLIDSIREAMGAPRTGRPVCKVCGRAVTARDECMRLRRGGVVHRRCTTYDVRRRRVVFWRSR